MRAGCLDSSIEEWRWTTRDGAGLSGSEAVRADAATSSGSIRLEMVAADVTHRPPAAHKKVIFHEMAMGFVYSVSSSNNRKNILR